MQTLFYNRYRSLIAIQLLLFLVFSFAFGLNAGIRVTDAKTGQSLPKASVFDKNGVFIAVADDNGYIPENVSSNSYPLNIRYVGYLPINVANPDIGVVKMEESTYALPEITVDDVSRNLLYIKAYERNYQSGTDANDTINYFTERIVDFVLPLTKKAGHKGWNNGRVLSERQYSHIKQKRKNKSRDTLVYRENRYNKSYGYKIDEECVIPESLLKGDSLKVIIQGKYSPKDVWTKVGDKYVLTRDNLADYKDHVNSPAYLKLLGSTTDFTRQENVYKFSPDTKGKIKPDDLTEAAYFDELLLKGKMWKMASEQKDPIPLKSYGELYVIDRAYLTADEVKELKKNQPVIDISFEAPEGIPAPPLEIVNLKAAVIETNTGAH